jgi:hypothetical protein
MRKWMSLESANMFCSLSDERGVSEVARGKKKSMQSDMGFMQAYNLARGRIDTMKKMPVCKKKPDGQTWFERRNNFVQRHVAQIRERGEDLFEHTGRYKGLPTRRHLALIMWAYSPCPKKAVGALKKLYKIKSKGKRA